MNFLISSIAMGSSKLPRVQASSQTLLHMRPQTAGKGFSFLDELQSVLVLALGGELYIALYGDVGRALGLAGGGAVVGDVGTVGAVVHVVVLLAPELLAGDGIALGSGLGAGGAELAAQLQGVHLAVFHALSAGHALSLSTLAT
jgi:hypothetical protein